MGSMLWTLLLYLLHSVVVISSTLTIYYRWLCGRLYRLSMASSATFSTKEMASLKITKHPNHVVVIVDAPIEVKEVACIIVWLTAARITYISIYDVNGEIRCMRKKLRHEVTALQADAGRMERFIFHDNGDGYGDDDGAVKERLRKFDLYPDAIKQRKNRNGFNNVHVSLLSLTTAGRQDIVSTAQAFCRRVEEGDCKADVLTQELLGANIKVLEGIPDPELTLIFGDLPSLHGCLPWQMRVSELHHMHQSHRDVRHIDIRDSLFRYSKCDQRLGT